MIETCCLPRSIEIGGRSYKLTPPPVLPAIQILHTLDHMEDEQDLSLLIDLICDLDWSPSVAMIRPMLIGIFRTTPLEFSISVRKWLNQGYEPKKIEKAITDTKAPKKGRIRWESLVEYYRQAYGGSRWEVLNEVPFPLFLESLKNASADRAKINIMRAIQSNPSEKTIKAWQQDAQGGPKEVAPVVNASPEEIKRSKELSANKKRMGK